MDTTFLDGSIPKTNSAARSPDTLSEMIRPSLKRNLPPMHPIRLHALDLLMPPINVRVPMLFKVQEKAGNSAPGWIEEIFESVVQRLKDSLADALELYPPVAGSIRARSGDASSDTVIVCDGRGAEFMTQKEEKPYKESENWLDGLAGTEIFVPEENLKSIFAVKLTLFSCGTIAMITSMYHDAADLTSYMDFLHTWARISRGEPVDLELVPQLWHRNGLTAPITPPSTMPGIFVAPPSSGPPPMPAIRTDGLRCFISAAAVEKLKVDCMANLSSATLQQKSWISSADALSALIWGTMTRARHVIPTKVPLFSLNHQDMESLGVAVDGRERLGLGSESGRNGASRYFGNLNLSLAVYAPRSDLLDSSIEATSRVALTIRTTLQNELAPEAIAKRIAFLEAQAEATKPLTRQRILLEGDCRSTNWSKYDLTAIDFGFGDDHVERRWTTIGTKSLYPAGMFLIVKADGGFIVATTVEKEADSILKSDPLMTKYVQWLVD